MYTCFVLCNSRGDVLELRNTDGSLFAKYEYDAWGNTTHIYSAAGNEITSQYNVAVQNPIRYRGYYYDSESGLYYLQSRYYDPQVTRYISPDTIDVSALTFSVVKYKNLFSYCDNSPIYRSDEQGYVWHIIIGAAIGATISGAAKLLSNAIDGESITTGLVTAIFAGAASGVLSATTFGLGTIILGNAAISMAENAANQLLDADANRFYVSDMLIDGALGAFAGALGGSGSGTKNLNQLGKQTIKRTYKAFSHNGIRAGLREAKKSFAYYAKSTIKYYKSYIRGAIKDLVRSFAVSTVTTKRAKSHIANMFTR